MSEQKEVELPPLMNRYEQGCYDAGYLKARGEYVTQIAALAVQVEELKEELQTWKDAGELNRQEYEELCAEHGVEPSSCCTKLCALVVFHHIRKLKDELAALREGATGVLESYDILIDSARNHFRNDVLVGVIQGAFLNVDRLRERIIVGGEQPQITKGAL